ncbi:MULTISPECIES: fimbrial protein [Winslowiella]|uniref:fimbrial protein n=1 Tax=Winslowiella TaxID=2997349 RepID=UPI0028BD9E4D|nr:fimbrial protein [Winslowiella toletana]WNN44046.1 fimbrial protein [Winslowiella toletana]
MSLKLMKITAVISYSMLFLSGRTLAEDIPISITGEVYIPACQVNGGETIEVKFGDISVTDVANPKNYQKISVPITCDYPQGTAYVKVTGTQLGANTNVLATNVSNFGIALYQGEGTSTKLTLGGGTIYGSVSIGYPITNGLSGKESGVFVFTAVPFKNGTGQLETKAFSASASMSISYF